jgi:hypothetical protein
MLFSLSSFKIDDKVIGSDLEILLAGTQSFSSSNAIMDRRIGEA